MTELPIIDKEKDLRRIWWNCARCVDTFIKAYFCMPSLLYSVIFNLYALTFPYNRIRFSAYNWLLGTLFLGIATGPLLTYWKAHLLWKSKWDYFENSQRRTYAYKFRSMFSLYRSPAGSIEEREKRRVFLKNELSILTSDMEQFQRAYPIDTVGEKYDNLQVISRKEITHVLLEFSDAKEFIGRELAALERVKQPTGARIEFQNIEGEAILQHEGQGVKRITIRIKVPGEYVLDHRNGKKVKLIAFLKGGTERKFELSKPLDCGNLRILNSSERVIEQIPLP